VFYVIISIEAKLKAFEEVFVFNTAKIMINTFVRFTFAWLAVQTMCFFDILRLLKVFVPEAVISVFVVTAARLSY
jgi:hypothetical protein